MKPKLIEGHDFIKSLLDESWEALPAQLEQRLNVLPTQVSKMRQSRYDKFVLVLNMILVMWTLGLIVFFSGVIGTGMMKFSEQLLKQGANLGSFMMAPGVFILIVLISIGFVWWKLDIDNT